MNTFNNNNNPILRQRMENHRLILTFVRQLLLFSDIPRFDDKFFDSFSQGMLNRNVSYEQMADDLANGDACAEFGLNLYGYLLPTLKNPRRNQKRY